MQISIVTAVGKGTGTRIETETETVIETVIETVKRDIAIESAAAAGTEIGTEIGTETGGKPGETVKIGAGATDGSAAETVCLTSCCTADSALFSRDCKDWLPLLYCLLVEQWKIIFYWHFEVGAVPQVPNFQHSLFTLCKNI